MARDFITQGIRTARIIASGSDIGDSSKPRLVIYNEDSNGANIDGTYNDSLLSGAGSDVFLFASGSIGSSNTTTRGVSLFGGDVVISGSLVVSGEVNVPDLSSMWSLDGDNLSLEGILDGDTGLFSINLEDLADTPGSVSIMPTTRTTCSDRYFEFDSNGDIMPKA